MRGRSRRELEALYETERLAPHKRSDPEKGADELVRPSCLDTTTLNSRARYDERRFPRTVNPELPSECCSPREHRRCAFQQTIPATNLAE